MIYFSDVLGVASEAGETCGAFNIALVNDPPLFVDPFLLFDNERPEYRTLHDDTIKYLVFVRDKALTAALAAGKKIEDFAVQ